MKKITYFNLFLFFISVTISAQTLTTGTVSLNPSANFTVKFDINTTNNTVTLTLTGDSNRWLGVAPGVAQGSSMGNSGDDVVIYSSLGLQDRNLTGSFGQPNVDSSQDWNLISDNTNGGIRTVIATRPNNTGDANDYNFPTTETTFPLIWANGSNTNINSGHSNRGGTVVTTTTLSNSSFELAQVDFNIYPNPSSKDLNISLSQNTDFDKFKMEVYDVLGKRVLTKTISNGNTSINIQDWNTGVYLIKIQNGKTHQTKRFIKN